MAHPSAPPPTDSIPFAALVQASGQAVLVCAGERWVFASEQATLLLGDAAALGASIWSAFVEDAEEKSSISSATHNLGPRQWIETARLDGEARTLLVCAPTLMRVDARAVRLEPDLLCVFLSDQAPSEALRARLQASERLQDKIVEAHPAVIYIFDLVEQRPIFANRQLAGLLGYPADQHDELVSRFAELLHPDDQTRLGQLLSRWDTATDDTILETLHRLRGADGTWRWFLGRDRVFRRDAAHNVTQIIGISTDITDRVLDEQALRASEERFRAIYESAGMGIALCALNRNLLECNAALSEMVGAEANDLRGIRLDELLAPGGRATFQEELDRLTPGQVYRAEFELTNAREPAWARITITVAGDASHPGYLIAMFENITLRKLAEAERAQREAAQLQSKKLESLGLLAGGVAHDFNNLLFGLLGNATLARKLIPADSVVGRHLALIESAAVAAGELTSQMLAFSGQGELNKSRVNLEKLLRETVDLLEVRTAAGSSTRPEFVFSIASDLPDLYADAVQLRQVCMNLVANATDAMRGREGRIFVRVFSAGGDRPDWFASGASADGQVALDAPSDKLICLEVEDEGGGMSEDTKSRIFDPFFTTRPGGRGLGLAAVLGIVRAHGGTIRVESTLGQGSTFSVCLPDTPPPAPTESTSSPLSYRGDALVIDDDEMVRDVTKSMLELDGLRVLAAESGHAGLQLFETHQFDVVILDLTMPDISGEEVFGRLRELNPRIPVLFTTGFIAHEASERLLRHPRVALLHKPYRLQALKSHLERVMESAMERDG